MMFLSKTTVMAPARVLRALSFRKNHFGVLKIYHIEPVDPRSLAPGPEKSNKSANDIPAIVGGDTLTDPAKKIQFFDSISGSKTFFVKKEHLAHLQDLAITAPKTELLENRGNNNIPGFSGTGEPTGLTTASQESSLATLTSFPTVTLKEILQLSSPGKDSSQRLVAPVLPEKRELTAEEEKFLEATLFGDGETVRAMLLGHDGGLVRTEFLKVHHPAHGGTALHIACSNGHVELVELFLSCGAAVNAKTFNGSTPLHWAMRHSSESENTAIVKLFLRHGADVQAATYTWKSTVHGTASGQTPAHWASDFGNHHLLDLLLDHTVEALDAKDDRRQTPLALVTKKGDSGIRDFILKKQQEEFVCVQIKVVHVAARAIPNEKKKQ